jgi:hypothetical protein
VSQHRVPQNRFVGLLQQGVFFIIP